MLFIAIASKAIASSLSLSLSLSPSPTTAAISKVRSFLSSSKPYSDYVVEKLQPQPQSQPEPQPQQLETPIVALIQSNPNAFRPNFKAPAIVKHLISSRAQFLSALHSIHHRPRIALRFFRWAERQQSFDRSEAAFSVILEILAEAIS